MLASRCWAWRRLRSTHGRATSARSRKELGWSRKCIVAHVRDEAALTPPGPAKRLRFERARELAADDAVGRASFRCGYDDQSHLIDEFRAITSRTLETFLQDAAASAA
jgi:AraC-like DNA-binding protein